jgi:hypothetical protein
MSIRLGRPSGEAAESGAGLGDLTLPVSRLGREKTGKVSPGAGLGRRPIDPDKGFGVVSRHYM